MDTDPISDPVPVQHKFANSQTKLNYVNILVMFSNVLHKIRKLTICLPWYFYRFAEAKHRKIATQYKIFHPKSSVRELKIEPRLAIPTRLGTIFISNSIAQEGNMRGKKRESQRLIYAGSFRWSSTGMLRFSSLSTSPKNGMAQLESTVQEKIHRKYIDYRRYTTRIHL